MATTVKADLKYIAAHLPTNASYEDAMYELYVRMKIAKGKQAVREGRIVAHEDVRKRFVK